MDKSTLYVNNYGSEQTISPTDFANYHIASMIYDEVYKEWHLLIYKELTNEYQRHLIYDENFSSLLADSEIVNTLASPSNTAIRWGITIRGNKDLVVCAVDGVDNYIFTFAKRQFWLRSGNIQHTDGPLDDTVFFDRPGIYNDELLDNTGSWTDFVVETDDYWLNCKSGELILKRPLMDGSRLWGNYDYHPSLNFPEVENADRFKILQEAAETESRRVKIDAYENVQLSEKVYEEVVPTMEYSDSYNTVLSFDAGDDVDVALESGVYNKIVTTTVLLFASVQKHDDLVITTAGIAGTYLIKEFIDEQNLKTYHDFGGTQDDIVGSVKRHVVSRSPRAVKLGQTYMGSGTGIQNIVYDSDHKTIRVFTEDYQEQLEEGTDYTIGTAAGEVTITFQNSALVKANPAVIVQYRVQEELYEIIDTSHIIRETEGWDEENIINHVVVNGQRLLPDLTRLTIAKQYAVAPYVRQQRSDLPLVQEANTTGQYNWAPDDERSDWEKDVANQNFLMEFEHPLIIGTSAYQVVMGDPANIEDSDEIEHTGRDAVFYFEITGSFSDAEYLVMVSNRKEFRLCTEEDYKDMVDSGGDWNVDASNDDVGSGTPPSSASDIKTASHFYIKQMNGAYAREDCKYIVYYEKTVDYYVDEQGRVVENSIDPNESDQGIFTGYPNKSAAIVITPKDSQGATLFEMHGVSGEDGYNSGANYADIDDESYALRVNRVQVDCRGVNFQFDNWGELTQYIQIAISAYPLTRVEKLCVDAAPTADEIDDYGDRSEDINNQFISTEYQARSLAYGIRNFYKDEKALFKITILFCAFLELEDLVEVSSPAEYLSENLMLTRALVDRLRLNSASETEMELEEVEDDA